jgi:hypothetical protein
MAWHPIHESLLLSGGYNGSLIYWLAGQNQVRLVLRCRSMSVKYCATFELFFNPIRLKSQGTTL